MNAHLKQSPPRPNRVVRVAFRLILVMSMLLAPFVAASSAHADTSSIRQAVVHLKQTWTAQVYVPLTKPLSGTLTAVTSCSGSFITAQADILTAGHCVDQQRGYIQLQAVLFNELKKRYPGNTDAELEGFVRASSITNQQLEVLVYQPDELGGVLNNNGIVAQVKQPSQTLNDGDHAYLKLNNFSKPTPFLKRAPNRPVEQDVVVAVGFPGAIQFSSDAARQNASFKRGVVSSFQTFGGAPYTEVDAGMEPGMSGGPVLNANEEIIGVVSWGRNDAKTVNFATDTETMNKFLASHGIAPDTAPVPQPSGSEAPAPLNPTPASDQGVPVWVWVVVALIVVGGVVAVVVLRGRNKVPTQGQQPPAVQPTQVWHGPSQQHGVPPQFGQQPQQWQPQPPPGQWHGQPQQPNVPPPTQGWPPNTGNTPQG